MTARLPRANDPVPSFPREIIDDETYRRLKRMVAPHVESFNYFVEYGLDEAIADVQPMEIELDDNYTVKLEVLKAELSFPMRSSQGVEVPLIPKEARESHSTYAGRLTANIRVNIQGAEENAFVLPINMGELPVMVMTQRCHLQGLTPSQLVGLREEESELGGYFLLRGIERVIRLLQVQRRNYPLAIERANYRNRGTNYSEKGVAVRCVRRDQSSVTNTLHYLSNGGATLRFVLRKQEFLLPVVLLAKALAPLSDRELFLRLVTGDESNTFLTTRLELLLRDFQAFQLHSKKQCLAYLGALFRGSLLNLSSKHSDEEVGTYLINRYIFVHVDSFGDKLEVLLFCLKKLIAFAQGRCVADNTDALSHHELLLPGHLIGAYVKEKVEEGLVAVRAQLLKEHRAHKHKFIGESVTSSKYHAKALERALGTVGQKVASFLSTGNIVTSTGMDLMQVSGYTIVAERLNYLRYLSHFQSVHRGQFFTTMKTTTVRKLLPESWGFLCPVHTPDGGPCGLLNHLAGDAAVLTHPPSKKAGTEGIEAMQRGAGLAGEENRELICSKKYVATLLALHGMRPGGMGAGDGQEVLEGKGGESFVPVLYDGLPLGGVPLSQIDQFIFRLRQLKKIGAGLGARGGGEGKHFLEPSVELAYIPPARGRDFSLPSPPPASSSSSSSAAPSSASSLPGAYPGLFIFSSAGRLVRPVYNLSLQCAELIGPLEQVYLNIACLPEEIAQGQGQGGFDFVELSPRAMLSPVASLTPYSDFNQSPRNMYQCQMGKQTMGTPIHHLAPRTDNKLYRILHVQAPLVQTESQLKYRMDAYPQGVNAVVAVIAYTGYDMEDAMILNKGAYERGLGFGYVYKTKFLDLDEEEKRRSVGGERPRLRLGNVRLGSTEVVLSSPQKGRGEGERKDRDGEGRERVQIGEEKYCEALDSDGLPSEGISLQYGEPLFCLLDEQNAPLVLPYKEKEPAFVERVRVMGARGKAEGGAVRGVSITLRYVRKPVIGDKFSSRHGQKGTLSILWPSENMPFSESGIVPDILINPHAFPSRMTIGMLIESMAGKAGSIGGHFVDASPFQFHEGEKGVKGGVGEGKRGEGGAWAGEGGLGEPTQGKERVIDYVGEQLKSYGYNYYGSEVLYNGLTGKEMRGEIFQGVVYYQRLRHMVSDKSQVRSTGPVNAITKQPVKGRKKGGGIRLGEMERDALLSHGVSFCLQDRLMNCSDAHAAYVCKRCGELLSVYQRPVGAGRRGEEGAEEGAGAGAGTGVRVPWKNCCAQCNSSDEVRMVMLPYVFRYLVNELAGMGIRLSLTLSE